MPGIINRSIDQFEVKHKSIVSSTTFRSHRMPAAASTPRFAWPLLASGVFLYMALSAPALFFFGIPYDAPGGSIVGKVHPGTWLVLLSFIILASNRGNPLKEGFRSLGAEPLLGLYLASMTTVLLWLFIRHGGSGATNVLETLIMPALGVAAVDMLTYRQRYRLLTLIFALLAVNTLIGFVESILHSRLIPVRIGGEEEVIEEYFRPSALLGHPLTNSLVTAALLPAAIYLRLSLSLRVALMVLLWVGVLAFGGRTAFVLATVGYGGYYFFRTMTALLKGRFNYVQITGGALGAVACVSVVAVGIAITGVGERIIHSLFWDGSAAVRLNIWSIFDYIQDTDFTFGMSPSSIVDAGTRMGLAKTEAIENFWLYIFLETGWAGYLPFLVAMVCVIAWLLKSTRGAMRVAVLIFMTVGSSNNSLATKSIVLLMFMTVVAITRGRAVPE